MPSPIDFYFDFSSPYGYLAAHGIDELAAGFGRAVNWRPFMLGVVFRTTGQTPLVSQPLRGPYHVHDLQRTARRLNLPFRMPDGFPMATLAAARAFYWAQGQSDAAARRLALALYDAAFARGVNITAAETVAAVASAAGFDASALAAGIGDAAIKERVKAETDAAIARGVFGSPFFIVDGEPFWGNDRLGDLRDWLSSGGW